MCVCNLGITNKFSQKRQPTKSKLVDGRVVYLISIMTTVIMTMNRRPTITPVVMSYEDTIRKNRQYGYDRDILGNKSTLPSPFNPDAAARRASETIALLRQRQQLEDQNGKLLLPPLRRPTLMDAMSVSTFKRVHAASTDEQSKLAVGSSKQVPMKSTTMTPTTKQINTASSKEAQKAIPTNPTAAAPTQPIPPPPKRKEVKKKKPETNNNDDFDNDEEIQALRNRISELGNKLEQVQALEASQIKAHQDRAKTEKERFYQRQTSHIHLPRAGSDRKLSQQAEKQQKMIEQLRRSNKTLRRDLQQLSIKMLFLHVSNGSLEMDQSVTQRYHDKLSSFHDSEQDIHRKVSSNLPKFRQKVEELDREAQYRAAWIAMEQRILANYETCQAEILTMMEERCNDEDLVEQLVRISLGLVDADHDDE